MADQPFKLAKTDAGIVRMPNGQFATELPPGPPQLIEQARREGKGVDDVVAENRAEIAKGKVSWDDARLRATDSGKLPFRVKG